LLRIDLTVGVDRVGYRIYDGRMISYEDEVMIEHETDTPQLAAEMALKLAFACYYRAAARISADGP
jgi:hypothetical protein